MKDYTHDTCRCGNIKLKRSKKCIKCHHSKNKHRNLSKLYYGDTLEPRGEKYKNLSEEVHCCVRGC